MKNQTIDEILETATADCFWVPPDVHIVDRPELSYIYSDRPAMGFNRVLRARPSQADPARLVSEVLKAHGDGNSQWTINAMSDTRVRVSRRDPHHSPSIHALSPPARVCGTILIISADLVLFHRHK